MDENFFNHFFFVTIEKFFHYPINISINLVIYKQSHEY